MRPFLLVTNDDGIDSPFLRTFAETLHRHYDLMVVAPHREQSGVGRSYTITRSPTSHQHFHFPFEAWSVDGTPSDCVNIALSHLMPKRPDAVVSGINIGGNLSVPILLSSGTVGGAMEGALWDLPALAFSLDVNDKEYVLVKDGAPSPMTQSSLTHACDHAVHLVRRVLELQMHGSVVHNINFPAPTAADTPVEHTRPAKLRMKPFFVNSGENTYSFDFGYDDLKAASQHPDNDMECCLERKHISHSMIRLDSLATLG